MYGSLIEFIKCWENGANSRLVLETYNGQAWVNLSCCLGRPFENHVVPARRKPRRQNDKNVRRAAEHKQKLMSDNVDDNADVKMTANKDDETKDTVDVWVNVITNDYIDVKTDFKKIEALSECVENCTLKELNVTGREYGNEADYKQGSIKLCG